MTKLIPTLLLIVISQFTWSQSNVVQGLTIYDSSGIAVPEANIELRDVNSNLSRNIRIVRSITSTKEGTYKIENLLAGKYEITATKNGLTALPYGTRFTIAKDDSLTINLKIKEPCKGELSHGICPHCGSNKKTALISPETFVDRCFSKYEHSIKFDEKIRKKGYESTVIYDDELIISMFIESEKENFNNPCYHWFCKRCEKVFK